MGFLIYLGIGVVLALGMKTADGGNMFDAGLDSALFAVFLWPAILFHLSDRVERISFRDKVIWERKG